MPDREVMIIHLVAWLIKRMSYSRSIKMSYYFPSPYEPFVGKISTKLDLSNYVTIVDLKGATGLETSTLAAKSDLVSLKAEIDKIDKIKIKDYSRWFN